MIVDHIGETLERWLIAQIVIMAAVFFVTWIGLAIIGVQSSFILGIQAGLLAFIPTVGAILAGLIVVLASLASGWVAAVSALILFLGVHVLESYILTPILQRQALEIPPATLFSFQILLGTVFGIWGLALALPWWRSRKSSSIISGPKPRHVQIATQAVVVSATVSCARPRGARQNTARRARATPRSSRTRGNPRCGFQGFPI